jgi:hypothetical protein
MRSLEGASLGSMLAIPLVTLGLGIALMLGARGLTNALARLREVGLPKAAE